MHDIFRKRFNLDSITPTKYNMSNKKPTVSRHFTNFVEIQTALNAKYKPIQWNTIEICNFLEGKGKQIAETLFLIARRGSNIYHALYMRERSFFVEFLANLVQI